MPLLLSLLFFATAPFYDGELVQAQIGNSPKLELEVVTKQKSIVRGLSYRNQIGHDGMLFVYKEPQIYRFWMKQMHFDLDIIWIRDRIVVDITHNAKAPQPSQKNLPLYQSKAPVNMILEVEAGRAAAWGIKVGSFLTILIQAQNENLGQRESSRDRSIPRL